MKKIILIFIILLYGCFIPDRDEFYYDEVELFPNLIEDENGRLILKNVKKITKKEIFTNEKGYLNISYEESHYDVNGYIISSRNYNKDHKVFMTSIYKYNNNYDLIEAIAINEDTVKWNYEYEYNSSGDIINKKSFINGNALFDEQFDPNSTKIVKQIIAKFTNTDNYKYIYDDNGNLNTIEKYIPGLRFDLTNRNYYNYDESNFLVEEIHVRYYSSFFRVKSIIDEIIQYDYEYYK